MPAGPSRSRKRRQAGDSLVAIKYPQAVEKAKQFLLQERCSEGRDLYDGGEAEARLIADIATSLFMMPSAVLEACRHSVRGQELLRYALALKIEAGEPIPEEFRVLAANFLRGTAPQKNRKTGRKEAWFLHSRIVWAIILLKAEGMSATRNDESDPESACDAVAAALKELELRPTTFAGVKRIWLAERPLIETAWSVEQKQS